MSTKLNDTLLILHDLTKTYGKARGIKNVNISVRRGEIFGFLGPNGAGKSTTIRTIMNFQSPTGGSATVFGMDSVKDSVEIKKRVGYLSGELSIYDDMTARQFLEYLGSFNDKFDWQIVLQLAKRFEAELDRKLRDLSKGNRQKIGLIQAFMHQPDLVILDEPTSGLDPLMQEEFFKLLEEVKSRGASVFFSSHNIAEIQRVADRAGFIREGEIVSIEDVGNLRNLSIHRLRVQFGDNQPSEAALKSVENVEEVHYSGNLSEVVVSGSVDALIKFLANYEVLSIDRDETSLEDVFLKLYRSDEGKNDKN